MTQIKIEGIVYQVDEAVVQLFDVLQQEVDSTNKQVEIHKKAVAIANEMISDCQHYIASIGIHPNEPLWVSGLRMRKQNEIEARFGLIGWLMENWSLISPIKCACGMGLIDYEAVRTTSKLICKSCFGSE